MVVCGVLCVVKWVWLVPSPKELQGTSHKNATVQTLKMTANASGNQFWADSARKELQGTSPEIPLCPQGVRGAIDLRNHGREGRQPSGASCSHVDLDFPRFLTRLFEKPPQTHGRPHCKAMHQLHYRAVWMQYVRFGCGT